jgi:hypothetical protein
LGSATETGNTNEAGAQFERVVRDFSDQPILVDLSRKNLANLGRAPATSLVTLESPAQSAARKEQQTLLEQEISLLEEKLQQEGRLVKDQLISPSELLSTRKEILRAKQKLAEFKAGLITRSFDWSAGEALTRQQLHALLPMRRMKLPS